MSCRALVRAGHVAAQAFEPPSVRPAIRVAACREKPREAKHKGAVRAPVAGSFRTRRRRWPARSPVAVIARTESIAACTNPLLHAWLTTPVDTPTLPPETNDIAPYRSYTLAEKPMIRIASGKLV